MRGFGIPKCKRDRACTGSIGRITVRTALSDCSVSVRVTDFVSHFVGSCFVLPVPFPSTQLNSTQFDYRQITTDDISLPNVLRYTVYLNQSASLTVDSPAWLNGNINRVVSDGSPQTTLIMISRGSGYIPPQEFVAVSHIWLSGVFQSADMNHLFNASQSHIHFVNAQLEWYRLHGQVCEFNDTRQDAFYSQMINGYVCMWVCVSVKSLTRYVL